MGSGAAGGMAAHVLTSHGMKVLLLEAGKKLNINKELKSMEWPYDHPRRGDLPPGSHVLTPPSTHSATAPYAKGMPYNHVYSYIEGWGKGRLQQEHRGGREGPSLYRHELCLGARALSWRQDQYLGTPRHCAFPITTSRQRATTVTARTGPSPTPTWRPITTRWICISASPGTRRICDYLPDSIFQRAIRLSKSEMMLRESLAKMGRVLTPYRAGVTTDGLKHNKYRSRCFGRGACERRTGGCDIHAAFDSPTGLILPGARNRESDDAHQCDGL